MSTILAIDDEVQNLEMVEYALDEEYEVIPVRSGKAALDYLKEHTPDLILLDIMMPNVDGLEVCKRLRSVSGTVGIIMLTAKTQEMDKVSGLLMGADDYITKPFNMKEVVLRVNNIIRRSYRDDLQLEVDGYLIDEKQRKVSSPNLANDIDLTTKEFELLILFVHNKGTAFSREDILNKIWGTDYFGSDRVVDDTLRRLRKKMPDLNIHTLYGFGYRLD